MDQALAHGPHDPPASRVGAQADRQARRGDNPPLWAGADLLVPGGHEHEGNDPHRLLAVRGAVCQGHEGGRQPLPVAEDLLGVAVVGTGHAIGDPGGHRRSQASDAGGDERRQDDLGHDRAPVHALQPRGHDDGADQATEQGVGGGRGQTEQPGGQVPQDGSGQTCEDHGRCGLDEGVVEEPTRDGLGHLGGQARSDDVEHGGHEDRTLGGEGPRRDGRGHRVGRVVKAVGEVKHQRGDDHDDDDEEGATHSSPSGRGRPATQDGWRSVPSKHGLTELLPVGGGFGEPSGGVEDLQSVP